MPDSYLKSLPCPLPEDILHAKGAGDFDTALELIERRLKANLPPMLRERLETEKMFLQQLASNYPLTCEDAVREMRQNVTDFTMEEWQENFLNGKLDFIFYKGQYMFHEDSCASLLKTQNGLNDRAMRPYNREKKQLEAIIAKVKEGGKAFRFRIRATMTFSEKTVQPDTPLRIHLPVPADSMQQSGAENIVCSEPIVSVGAADDAQRTVYIEKRGSKPVTLEYSYVQRPKYVNPMDETIHEVIYPKARPVCDEDLREEAPHICFTPYLRSLAAYIRGDETDTVRLARRIYDYITENVIYAYQRPYLLIEGGAEYTAVNRHGDCGLQALLFITLCRICGIPARWQSGLYAEPGDVGSHDWAEFYSERLGWLPADCSFGGTALRFGGDMRWNYYFGNLDPWRMVANRCYYAPFTPEKKFSRHDPYDSQRGEAETPERGLHGSEYHTSYEMISYEETEENK